MQIKETSNRQSLAGWWGSSTILLAILGMLGVHAPARIKLIGLFAVAIGLLGGFILRYLAVLWGLRSTKSLIMTVAVMLLALQIGIVVGAWQRQVRLLDAGTQANPILAQLALQREQVLAGRTEVGSEERKLQDEMLQSIDNNERMFLDDIEQERRFAWYLQQRLSGFGALTPPWPTLVWSLEVLIGTVAGVWLFRRMFQSPISESNNQLKEIEKGIVQ